MPAILGSASFHLESESPKLSNPFPYTVGVFGGSVVLGEGTSPSGLTLTVTGADSDGAYCVGAASGASTDGTGLRAGRGAFFRFTVFLLASLLSS